MLLVRHDTLHTITLIDLLLGKLRVRSPQKIEHAMKEFEAHLDLAALDRALGLA
jgi:BioD-like phosphotransacetylase family protein